MTYNPNAITFSCLGVPRHDQKIKITMELEQKEESK